MPSATLASSCTPPLAPDEARPWIWLIPLLGGVIASLSFFAATNPGRATGSVPSVLLVVLVGLLFLCMIAAVANGGRRCVD
jgi:hypothetical protein